MDRDLLHGAREAAFRKNRRVQLTLPSVLARGETFSLRLSAFDADALPDENFRRRIVFTDSVGVDGLPESVAFPSDAPALLELDGLKATGGDFAVVRAEVADTPGVLSSNPAWIFDEPPYRLYWGDLHVHTLYSDCQQWACRDPEFGYQYARDAAHLDFAAAADHLRGIAAEPGRWPRLADLVRRYDEPGRFVPFLAFESSHATGFGGDNNVYYRDADGPYFWLDREDMRGNRPAVPLEELWEWLDGTGQAYFTAPHHTGRRGKYRTFAEPTYDAQREPLFEIYSAWGSSEKRWSRHPVNGGNNDHPSYFVDALRAGCRFGVIASSDDHTTLPGGESRNGGSPLGPQSLSWFHHKGLAAVRAPELTREALWDALIRRRTYATTFDRTLVDLSLGDLAMGQAARVGADDPLRKKRTVRVRFSTTAGGDIRVTLMRNGMELERQMLMWNRPRRNVEEALFEDESGLEDIAVTDARFREEPFAVYYVRIETGDGQTQWTSPIWLDA